MAINLDPVYNFSFTNYNENQAIINNNYTILNDIPIENTVYNNYTINVNVITQKNETP